MLILSTWRAILFTLVGWVALTNPLAAAEGGVILVYHHVSESTPASTSVSPQVFKQHLNYLAENNFTVMPLVDMLNAVKHGNKLPERAIAITFDDAYSSVYDTAFPLLKKRQWPFTVYVPSDAIDKKYQGYMSWSQIRELHNYGAEIGGHSASHAHLIRQTDGEARKAWLARVTQDIDRGNARIKSKTGKAVTSFAYPYGESNQDIQQLIKQRDLFGLAQQSGAVGPATQLQAIPRYPLAQSYASMERFALIAHSKALPVIKTQAGDLVRIEGKDQGSLGLKLQAGDYRLAQLACYSATGDALTITTKRLTANIQLPAFKPGRNKVNCTAPATDEQGVYYWYSQLWVVKTEDGQWPKE